MQNNTLHKLIAIHDRLKSCMPSDDGVFKGVRLRPLVLHDIHIKLINTKVIPVPSVAVFGRPHV